MKTVNFQWFSAATDGRNDMSDTMQFVFVRGIYTEVNTTEKFIALMPMKGTTV
jgi:hypothetical protein